MDASNLHRSPGDFPAPGWYRDAIDPSAERYWSGTEWLMAAPDPEELAEVEEIEPERPLTERERKNLSTDASNLFGEVAPPVADADKYRLIAWIVLFVLMFSLLFVGPVGLIISGIVGIAGAGASLYYRNKENMPVGYVPFVGLGGILLIIIGVILLFVSLAVHNPLPTPNFSNEAPGL